MEAPRSGKLYSTTEADILYDIIRNRRDVRGNRFLNKPLEETVVRRVMSAALHAPSVGFSQPWEFVLIRDAAVKRAVYDSYVAEKDRSVSLFADDKQQTYQQLKLEGILEAPLNIAVFYKPSSGPVLGQTAMQEVGLYSVVCAVQNMWLMARALNIGLGWVSILDPEHVGRILGAPEQNRLVAYLCLGYTDGFYTQPELELLQWEKRKLEEAVILEEGYGRGLV
ncbi:5,6-dimethylbenzimidazole synthase [Dinghuibacter silviterrae]|uniref:Cob(II)yrinic acid a,c-diamide reductase n=1 Tax=Dinghuibacter silviterrae TaxID=1539049 RepID=A0A4R8DY01_9BACT|nr:5,6-dimethylbenzimidazole synthase [Dinghuibacter silviterrae]TDX02327.1 cob(II)yrinic acid a,c-diamide reductase [Dinghuibacter silviterrae]